MLWERYGFCDWLKVGKARARHHAVEFLRSTLVGQLLGCELFIWFITEFNGCMCSPRGHAPWRAVAKATEATVLLSDHLTKNGGTKNRIAITNNQ